MKKFLIALVSVGLALCGVTMLAPVALAADGICADYPDAPGCNTSSAEDDFETQVRVAVNVVVGVAGFIAVGFVIYGGILITMSAGDPNKVKRGKDTVMYAVIGMIVAVLAFAIVNFATGRLGI